MLRVHSLNNIPSQVRTLVFSKVPGSVRGDFGRFCSILGDFTGGTLPNHTKFPGSWVGKNMIYRVHSYRALPPGEHPVHASGGEGAVPAGAGAGGPHDAHQHQPRQEGRAIDDHTAKR